MKELFRVSIFLDIISCFLLVIPNVTLAQHSEVLTMKEKEFSKQLVEEYFDRNKDSLLTKEVKWKYYFSSDHRESLKKFSSDIGILNFDKTEIESYEAVYHMGLIETRTHSPESLYETILKLNKIAAQYGIGPTETFGAKDKNAKPCYPKKEPQIP